jgi:hypothetical protein
VAEGDSGDVVILHSPQGLNPVVGIRRHLALAQEVVFQSVPSAEESRNSRAQVAVAGIRKAIGHDARHLGEHLAGSIRASPEDLIDGPALEGQHGGIDDGTAAGSIGLVTKHRPFADEVALPEAGDGFLDLAYALENLDFATLDHHQLGAGSAGAKEVLPQLEGSSGDPLCNLVQILIREVLKQDDTLENGEKLRHMSLLEASRCYDYSSAGCNSAEGENPCAHDAAIRLRSLSKI